MISALLKHSLNCPIHSTIYNEINFNLLFVKKISNYYFICDFKKYLNIKKVDKGQIGKIIILSVTHYYINFLSL
ncbi:hypothetical protein XBJ2_330008 [Xenorhabdus bovienii str. Jollieti]|uniref:Uncharacterized protein n=1 Tax=Xenorhabdus bovienii (strain SS-2004) TaxID=406818 RepID=D3UWN0_XENBS|nr:hypothetical protein XBJ1_0724 [Xenorhabdus bovienii SS-2004]CDH29582.1 hypothetical protein XBJ2_330008 [Xenorhabdus bovienii str. Jollieti]